MKKQYYTLYPKLGENYTIFDSDEFPIEWDIVNNDFLLIEPSSPSGNNVFIPDNTVVTGRTYDTPSTVYRRRTGNFVDSDGNVVEPDSTNIGFTNLLPDIKNLNLGSIGLFAGIILILIFLNNK